MMKKTSVGGHIALGVPHQHVQLGHLCYHHIIALAPIDLPAFATL